MHIGPLIDTWSLTWRTNTHYLLESTCMGYMKLPAFTAGLNLAADEYRISGSSRYSAGPIGYACTCIAGYQQDLAYGRGYMGYAAGSR